MRRIRAGTSTATAGEFPAPLNDVVGLNELLRLLRMTGMVALVIWLIAGSVIMAQTSSLAKALNPQEKDLIAHEKRLIEAKKKDDGAFFKQTVSDDFALVGVDGRLLERQEALDNLGDSALLELTPYDVKILVADDHVAIVTYDAVVREKPQEDQGPPPRYQHFSSVWIMQGEVWKLKFHQATAAHWGDW